METHCISNKKINGDDKQIKRKGIGERFKDDVRSLQYKGRLDVKQSSRTIVTKIKCTCKTSKVIEKGYVDNSKQDDPKLEACMVSQDQTYGKTSIWVFIKEKQSQTHQG